MRIRISLSRSLEALTMSSVDIEASWSSSKLLSSTAIAVAIRVVFVWPGGVKKGRKRDRREREGKYLEQIVEAVLLVQEEKKA